MEVDISKDIRRKTVENFSWDEIATATIKLYNKLLCNTLDGGFE